MSAPLLRIPVGVLVERRPASSPWIAHVWSPAAVLPGEPEAAPWTIVSQTADTTTFFAGASSIALYASETGNYRDNLVTGAPKLWVALRATGVDPPFELLAVTADPAEGEGYTATGDDLVEPVPMPEGVRDAIEAFVVEHHVEQEFFKRKRKPADPEALGKRPRGERDD